MADISDVESALVSIAGAALYPAGTSAPSVVSAICKVYRGWPIKPKLDADLKVGTVNVSVFASPGTTRNSTRYELTWQTYQCATVTFTASVSGNTVMINGAGGAVQLVGLKVNGVPCVYTTTTTDTPATVASALAALVTDATASGAVVTVPGNPTIIARIEGFAVVGMEIRRQWQRVMVSCWCSTPVQRDAVAKAVDGALAVYDGGFIPLPDGTSGHLIYRNSSSNDVPSQDNLWRRDLVYDIEYPTVTFASAPPVMWPSTMLTILSNGGVQPPLDINS